MHKDTLSKDAAGPEFAGRVAPKDNGVRLDKFLAGELGEDWSRGRVQNAIQDGLVRVDGLVEASAKRRLKAGETVDMDADGPDEAPGLTPEAGELDVRYEDERLVVVHKPAGLTTHPAPSCPDGTLVHRLLGRYAQLAQLARLDPWRPGIVHRLDKDTSGLMVVALDEAARLDLSAQFAGREVRKEYLALVHGVPDSQHGEIELPIGRHPTQKTRMAVLERGGRYARSAYRVLYAGHGWCLLRVRIFTGRTHQIRVHLAAVGHPILGDVVYGSRQQAELHRERPACARLAGRQMLHAHDLEFRHPDDFTMHCLAAPPKDFTRLPLAMERSAQRVGLTGLPGSGKSHLLGLLAKRGIPTISADAIVAELYRTGADGAEFIRRRFGGLYLHQDGGVDKKALFAAMAGSGNIRREVETLVHPLVAGRVREFFERHQDARLAVAEVPLLAEAGWAGPELDIFERVVGIALESGIRREWLTERRGLARDTAQVLESWHWPEHAKLAKCDIVVKNPGDPDGLEHEASSLLARLKRLRAKRMRQLAAELATHMPDGPCGRSAFPCATGEDD